MNNQLYKENFRNQSALHNQVLSKSTRWHEATIKKYALKPEQYRRYTNLNCKECLWFTLSSKEVSHTQGFFNLLEERREERYRVTTNTGVGVTLIWESEWGTQLGGRSDICGAGS